MQLPIPHLLTIISALDSHRLTLRSIITQRDQAISDDEDRNEIIADLRISTRFAQACETLEMSVSEEESLYISSVLNSEKAYLACAAREAAGSHKSYEYTLAHQAICQAEQALSAVLEESEAA